MRICWNICASQLSPTTVSRACFTLELPVWSGIIITCATESLLQLLQLDDKHKILSFSQKRRKTWPNQQLKVNVVAVVTFVVSSTLLLFLVVVVLLLLSMLLLFCSWLCESISCNLLWIEACCPQWPGWLLIAYLLLIHPGPQVRVLKPQVHQFSLKHNICHYHCTASQAGTLRKHLTKVLVFSSSDSYCRQARFYWWQCAECGLVVGNNRGGTLWTISPRRIVCHRPNLYVTTNQYGNKRKI